MIYFISDLHFSTKGKLCEFRGFKTPEEMDEHIIKEYNKVVHENDIVYILGDIGNMEKIKLLKGKKHLIRGNHDTFTNKQLLSCGFESINDYLILERRIWLSHIPIKVNESIINIHGHLHMAHIRKNNYINVSCEYINYKPISLKEIHTILGNTPKENNKFMEEWFADLFERGLK